MLESGEGFSSVGNHEAHQENLQKWVLLELVFEGTVGFQQEKFLEKHIPERGYHRRKATWQNMNEIKYSLPVSWNKKLSSLTVAQDETGG